MEQLQSLKQQLAIPTFPPFGITGYFSLGAYEVTMLATAISLILTLSTGSPFWIYLINGLLLPLLVSHYCGPLEHYWEWFSVLLLVRQLTRDFVVLDVAKFRFRRYCWSVSGTPK